eukprot:gene2843-biopygen3066
MAVAQNTYTSIIVDSATDAFVTWIVSVTSSATPSDVYSISYGIQESDLVGYSNVDSFNTEAMKLGAMGVTVLVSSGDDGAPGDKARGNPTACAYDPSFPASSPYVTAVGATRGAENGGPEVVCDANLGGVITSGGGFSLITPAFSQQQRAINGYFKQVSTQPVSGYSTTGRGLPDVSLAGYLYKTVVNGATAYLCGTSASTPAFAGMVSLVNAARKAAGRPTLGWLNPTLYASNGSFANDVVSGNNKCTENGCCSQGFYASPGWDPATGFGSVDFTKFYNLFMGTSAPTAAPATSRPTPNLPTLLPPDTRAFQFPNPISFLYAIYISSN